MAPKPIRVDEELRLLKFELLDTLLIRTYSSFAKTLDTEDFVSEQVNKKIRKIIFKNFKQSAKRLNKTYKKATKRGIEISSQE